MKFHFRLAAAAAGVALIAVAGMVAAPAASADSTADPFDAAQSAMGLSPEDAQFQAPGVSTEVDPRGTSISLGRFDLRVTTPMNTQTDTTVLQHGARVMTLLNAGEESTTFDFTLPSSTTLVPRGEGFDIVAEANGTILTLGRVAAPWAVDANGKKLPTAYTLDGHVVTQHVETAGATFPVIADPAVTVGLGADGPGAYWNMYGYQADAIAAASVSAVSGALAGGCAAANKVPVIGGWLTAACGFVGAPTMSQIFGTIHDIIARSSHNGHTCYQILLAPWNSGLHETGRSNCA